MPYLKHLPIHYYIYYGVSFMDCCEMYIYMNFECVNKEFKSIHPQKVD